VPTSDCAAWAEADDEDYSAAVLESEWLPRAQEHRQRAEPWVAGRLARQPRGEKNAIEDFLFDYYPYSPGKLATWHPGYGVVLEGDAALPYLSLTGYHRVDDGVTADLGWLSGKTTRLDTAIRILSGTSSRTPVTGCFGLHEWAMVYGQTQREVRHTYLPLRVRPEVVSATVDAVGLRCTHIDAFRFFTPAAVPLNSLAPTRDTQPNLEQPGCLHAGMDLYKYAFWFSPLVPSELVLDCFENAARARELDMRASPYDMAPFGLEPIRVETPDGRREYAEQQQLVMASIAPLRERLLTSLRQLSDASGHELLNERSGGPATSCG
jgi:hypothetical protein